MTAMTVIPDGQAQTDRRKRAERRFLLLKWAGFAVLLCGSVALLMGQAKPQESAKVVEAERFVLRDANGKARAELGLKDGVPVLALFDAQGNRRTQLAVAGDGSTSLSLYDKDGNRKPLKISLFGDGQSLWGSPARVLECTLEIDLRTRSHVAGNTRVI